MFKKNFNIFRKKNTRFKETIKKEKARFYMFRVKKSSSFKCKRKKNNIFQLKFNFNKKIILYFYIFGFLLSFALLLYIFRGDYFSIKHINIKINDTITDENIAYKSIDSIRNKSIFLENKEKISEKILNYQKNINKIEISKVLPDTLNITLGSFPILMDISYNGKKYYLTSNGILLPYNKINKDDKRIFVNIIQEKKDKYKIFTYKKIFDKKTVNKILTLIKGFKDNLLNNKITKIDFYLDENELHIITKNNTIFIFELNKNIEKQLKKLLVYSKEKDNILKYVYIDLRIEDKIFLCPYKKEYQCLKNYRRIYNKKQ